jgi:hypothetical protein
MRRFDALVFCLAASARISMVNPSADRRTDGWSALAFSLAATLPMTTSLYTTVTSGSQAWSVPDREPGHTVCGCTAAG